jgi:predicted dehydrogenase
MIASMVTEAGVTGQWVRPPQRTAARQAQFQRDYDAMVKAVADGGDDPNTVEAVLPTIRDATRWALTNALQQPDRGR